jgi:microcystin-dependent protein
MAFEPFIGQIQIFAFDFPPRNWALCNGQLLSIASNSSLFSLLGTQYGGDGRVTFGLPDLRGRVPISQGQGPGLSNYVLGERSGSENVTLFTAQMPAHTHIVTTTAAQPCQSAAGNSDAPASGVPATNHGDVKNYSSTSNGNLGAATVNTTIAPAGGSQPHPNQPPYLTMNICISLQGLFPSRN